MSRRKSGKPDRYASYYHHQDYTLLRDFFVYLSMATKKVPQRKNKNAGKSTGKSNKETRKKKTPGKDVSHTKSGKLVREKRSVNRARNGKNGKSSKK